MSVTSSVATLPARVVPLPGESLVSLVRRTAAVMGYEGPHRLRTLIVDVGKVQANVNVLRPGPILDILAVLLRQPPEMLLSMTVHRLAPTLVFPGEPSQMATLCDSKTMLKFFSQGEFPICPACLRQDAAPYERLAWSLYALPACCEHRCSLIARCPACRRPLRSERRAVSMPDARVRHLRFQVNRQPVRDAAVSAPKPRAASTIDLGLIPLVKGTNLLTIVSDAWFSFAAADMVPSD